MALNIDLAPTLLDYAGIGAPPRMQGRSLRPLVEGKRAKWRRDFYYEHHFGFDKKIPETEGVRAEHWTYLRYVSADPAVEELYDLQNDPLEENNLAVDRQRQKTLTQLRARWQGYREHLK